MKKMLNVLSILVFFLISCNKEDDFLDEKYRLSDVVPTTIAQFQSLLDNESRMNTADMSLQGVSMDNYYVNTTDWQGRLVTERNAYIWSPVIYPDETNNDYSNAYERIMICNSALDGAKKIVPSANETVAYNTMIGCAYFYRAFNHYNAVQIFAMPYVGTNGDDPGVPARTTSDISIKPVRNSLKEVYDLIFEDLMQAASLLPVVKGPVFRPNQNAAYALLARAYFGIADYANAEKYASLALSYNGSLIDFNTLDFTKTNTFPTTTGTNPEVILHILMSRYTIVTGGNLASVDSQLFKSYAANDLRRSAFYRPGTNGKQLFKGSYSGASTLWNGFANNELYLIKAESQARMGQYNEGIATLNTLMEKRYNKNSFLRFSASNQTEAINIIVNERRKELVFSGQRWEDLRRLNFIHNAGITCRRVINNQVYELKPTDNRYALPIPSREIRLYGFEQNNRY